MKKLMDDSGLSFSEKCLIIIFIFSLLALLVGCKNEECATCLKESWETRNGNTIYKQESFEACGADIDYWNGRKTDESFIINNQWVNYKTETTCK